MRLLRRIVEVSTQLIGRLKRNQRKSISPQFLPVKINLGCGLAASEKDKMLSNNFFVEDDDSYYARHKYMYDFDMLADTLKRVGFHDIRRCEYRKGHTPDLDCLDNRPDESLFVEATR